MQLILPPDRGKRGYRLKCRFRIEPRPTQERLKEAARKALEWFVQDMAKEGWQYWPQGGLRFKGPFAPVDPVTIHPVRTPSSRAMLPAIKQGARFRAQETNGVQLVVPLAESEFWEYELAAVFVHSTILVERPDRHEELEALRTR